MLPRHYSLFISKYGCRASQRSNTQQIRICSYQEHKRASQVSSILHTQQLDNKTLVSYSDPEVKEACTSRMHWDRGQGRTRLEQDPKRANELVVFEDCEKH